MITRGEAVELPDDAFGPCFHRASREEEVFDLGFDRRSLAGTPAVVTGVTRGSAADKAGLRDGALVIAARLPADAAAAQKSGKKTDVVLTIAGAAAERRYAIAPGQNGRSSSGKRRSAASAAERRPRQARRAEAACPARARGGDRTNAFSARSARGLFLARAVSTHGNEEGRRSPRDGRVRRRHGRRGGRRHSLQAGRLVSRPAQALVSATFLGICSGVDWPLRPHRRLGIPGLEGSSSEDRTRALAFWGLSSASMPPGRGSFSA